LATRGFRDGARNDNLGFNKKAPVALFSFLVRLMPFVGEKPGLTLYPEH
jgi:hypothetical protein